MEYNLLLNLILNNNAQVVYGSRYLSQRGHFKENNHLTYRIHTFGNNYLSFITSLLYGQKITDMETCYQVLRNS